MIKENLTQHRNQEPFENIRNGIKKMEIRLNDEKRQKIKLNHIIKIINRDDENEILFVKVIGLSRFPSFEKLYSVFNDRIKDYEKEILKKFYSKEKEDKYGVLVIHIELLE
ncbi:ASCH domain-containing protein [Candidatus Pacearchaeota archaeon]|nr:ASCH domain-containing protein [Candidatus Pacearchaeota archaeon]